MKKVLRTVCAVALAAAFVAQTECQAGIVISIDQKMVEAGQTVLLGVYASSDSGDVISGFNLPFDYNNDGFVDAQNDGLGDLPTGFTFTATPLTNIIYSNTGLDQPRPQVQLLNADSIVTGTGGDIVLGNSQNPTKLFELSIAISPNVPVGTVVPFQIKVPNEPFTSLFNVAGPGNPNVIMPLPGIPAFGSITIVAVPEPTSTSLTLSTLVLTMGVYGWRQRRNYA